MRDQPYDDHDPRLRRMNPTEPATRVEVQNGQKGVFTIGDIEDLVRWVLEENGLTLRGWGFAWDRRIRRAGCCDHACRRIHALAAAESTRAARRSPP